MNKLEKIKTESTDLTELESENTAEEIQEESEETKKKFSFFTFWKKMSKEEENEEIFEENDEEKESKGSFVLKFLNKRTTVLASCVLVIAIAGYLNIRYSNPAENIHKDAIENGAQSGNVIADSTDTAALEDTEEDYFALAVINRERVRDEAIEMLKDVASSDITDVSAKNEAYVQMTQMANEIADEANIESLVKAKGFDECVAVISNDTANVIVQSDGLTINEVAQIKEIVYLESGVIPDNIKIIEKSNA